jgi:dephospho-CoA kinase
MYTVGLTGGIGSGKSAAAQIFKDLGITVVDADKVSRLVVKPESLALNEIRQHFGETIIKDDGTLNRSALRKIVFGNQRELNWLESLLHPAINKLIKTQLASATSEYSILESPILIESKQHKMVDRILVIDVSQELQLERASQRDASSREQIKAIMANQLSREERLAKADDVIVNDSDLASLKQSIMALHSNYLKLARRKNSPNA